MLSSPPLNKDRRLCTQRIIDRVSIVVCQTGDRSFGVTILKQQVDGSVVCRFQHRSSETASLSRVDLTAVWLDLWPGATLSLVASELGAGRRRITMAVDMFPRRFASIS